MKKFTIATLVGAIIMFVYSAASWMMLPVHTHTFHYTPKQDSIVKVLSSSLPGSGVYMVPMADNRNAGMFDAKYREADEELMKKMVGQPSAVIFYTASNVAMDPMEFIRGFLLDIFAMIFAIAIFLIAKEKLTSFFMRWWVFMALGAIIVLNTYLIEWNFMGFPWHYIKGMVFDVFVEWGLCGAWVAWYYRKA